MLLYYHLGKLAEERCNTRRPSRQKKKICIKLWNDHADAIAEEAKGKNVSFHKVEVDIFNIK